MDISLIIPTFLAGILTFLAPCTLPLVPGYLGFISGSSLEDLNDPTKATKLRFKVFLNGLFYVIGFSVVFIIMGTLAGLAGAALAPFRIWLTRIGGLFVIIFGLFMIGILKLPFLNVDKHAQAPKIFKRGTPMSSLMLGSAFGFGWTPCVGPILGSVLLLAGSSATAGQGAFLLTIFSLGLAIPFLLLAIGIGSAQQRIQNFSKYLNYISVIGGIFLVGLGILLFTNKISLLISWGFQFLSIFNYDAILKFL